MSKSDRIVVFTVGGVIKISSRIVVSSRVYIAGQTAPGDVSPHPYPYISHIYRLGPQNGFH